MNLIKKILLASTVFLSWGKLTGWRAAITWTALRIKIALGFEEPAILSIHPRYTKYPVLVRLGDSSDIDVFSQIFRFKEYACLKDIPSPRLILDLGANVGYSSAFFLSCFPLASVTAVEPDPASFEILRKNLAQYGERARLVRGAVWSRNGRLKLLRAAFGDRREWATQVIASPDPDDTGIVEGFDIPTLLGLSSAESIDLLKIDIERSELELFDSTYREWLPKVRNICIELHGDDCREAFMRALEGFDFELGSSGELTVCRNLRLRHPKKLAKVT